MRLIKILAVNLLLLLLLLGLSEGAVHLMMKNPARIPGPLLSALRSLYWADKDLIQFSPECSQYDERLTYTFRPGTCTFAGAEFSNVYHVNHLGLRDDEASLNAPEIIVLGDSHAVGWGVDQQEVLAQVIEARTGITTLNAAISSYGTAREVLNLQRLDRSRLRLLIIQYSANDLGENRVFRDTGNRLNTMERAQYEERVRTEAEVHRVRYALGQHLRGLVRNASLGMSVESVGSIDQRDSAELFLNVLANGGVPLDGVDIITFEVSNYGFVSKFVGLLQTKLSAPDRPQGFRSIKAIDAAKILGSQHYLRLDGHLNAAGHRALADVIVKEAGLPVRGTAGGG